MNTICAECGHRYFSHLEYEGEGSEGREYSEGPCKAAGCHCAVFSQQLTRTDNSESPDTQKAPEKSE